MPLAYSSTPAALAFCEGDIDAAAQEASIAMIDAARIGDASSVRVLIDQGVDVDSATEDDMTALMFAAQSGHLDVVNILLGANADFNCGNDAGHSAVLLAAGQGHMQVIEALNRRGANLDFELQAAIRYGTDAMKETLLDAGANPDAVVGEDLSELARVEDRGHADIAHIMQMVQADQGVAAAPGMHSDMPEDEDIEMLFDPQENSSAEMTAWPGECSAVCDSTAPTPLLPMSASTDGIHTESPGSDASDAGQLFQWPVTGW